MSDTGGQTEEELREKLMDMTNDELIQEALELNEKANRVEKVTEDLFLANARKEAAERKVSTLESEGHTLLSRAMEAEERIVALTADNEKLTAQVSDSGADAEQMKKDAEELESLRKEVDELRDAKSLIAAERKKAEEHNELRLSVEHAFNELSKQHEDLMQQLDEAQAEARMLRGKAKEDALLIDQLQTDKDKLASELEAARADAQAAKEREAKTAAELQALQKQAHQWKRDAERALALESKCDSMQRANERQAQELKALQAQLREAQLAAQKFDEERRKWASERRKDKANQFLKEQLQEIQSKYNTLVERERFWMKERAELQAKIKRLTWELRNKNPSQLRLMEMEVQNQLLLGMLQNTKETTPKKSAKAHYGGSPLPAPRVLPPLSSSATEDGGSPNDPASPTAASEPPSPKPLKRKLSKKGSVKSVAPAAKTAPVEDPDADMLDRLLEKDAGEPIPPPPPPVSSTTAKQPPPPSPTEEDEAEDDEEDEKAENQPSSASRSSERSSSAASSMSSSIATE